MPIANSTYKAPNQQERATLVFAFDTRDYRIEFTWPIGEGSNACSFSGAQLLASLVATSNVQRFVQQLLPGPTPMRSSSFTPLGVRCL